MVENLLNELSIVNRATRFVKPPQGASYAVWFDTFESRGSDDKNLIREHDYTIELYEYSPDPATEKAIENKLDLLGIQYAKQDRTYLESEQLYQVIYEFTIVEKGGRNDE